MIKNLGVKGVAEQLHHYLKYRAAHEGVEYGLSPEFFHMPIEMGVRCFFGIEIGYGGILRDTQQPELFKSWRRLQ
jgi:hypothetical protein